MTADQQSVFTPDEPGSPPRALIRPIYRSLLFVLLGAILLFLISTGVSPLVRGMPQLARLILPYAVMNSLLLVATWLFLRTFDRRSFRALGLWFYAGWGGEAAVGSALGVVLISGVAIVLGATRSLTYGGLHRFSALQWIQLFGAAGVFLLAAAFEEIAFRGYAFQRLVDAVGPIAATLAFASLFAAGHLGNPHHTFLSTLNTALAGVLLAAAYLRTSALWLPIGLHWAWNFFMGPIFSLPVSGVGFGPKLFAASVSGPVWLTGGAYGPEGGVVVTMACIAGTVWLARSSRLGTSVAMAEVLK